MRARLMVVGTAAVTLASACSPAAIRIQGCPPRALPPTPEVVSVPAADCRYALCFDSDNAAALQRKLSILEEAAGR